MNDGGPAFPGKDTDKVFGHDGMSLRDWFAGMALMGYRANSNLEIPSQIATWSYRDADAMLAKHEKEAEK